MRPGPGARRQFPALRARGRRRAPAYLDSACLSLVPERVLHAMEEYYREYPGCAGRSVHRFSEEVGRRFEAARERFARFFRAPGGSDSTLFLKNSTEAINLVAQGVRWNPGDRVLVSDQEHNSNLVPWLRLAEERGVRVDVLPLPDDRPFDLDAYQRFLERTPRLVSLFHASNLDGRILPAREIVEAAHDRGAKVLLDGCQAAPHRPVDLRALGADFYAVSAHKMLGPTGTGVLFGTPESLGELRPLSLGGETVESTRVDGYDLRPPPYRFEAGLQNYAGFLGAAEGLDFLEACGLDAVEAHDRALNERATRALRSHPRFRLVGPPDVMDRPSILAFALDGIDPNDAALFLDEGAGVMVRSGRHCVHSWYESHGLEGTVRASFYLYNTREDVDRLVEGVLELLERVPGKSPRPRRAAGGPTGTSAATR